MKPGIIVLSNCNSSFDTCGCRDYDSMIRKIFTMLAPTSKIIICDLRKN